MKSKGYTLVELLVVVVIIGLMAGLGIPAFMRFGRVSVFNQKTAEIKSAIEQINYLARNPESPSIQYYQIAWREDDANGNKLVLISSDGTTETTFKEIKMDKGQAISVSDDTNSVQCSTVITAGCTTTPGTAGSVIFQLMDTSVNKRADFSIELPKFTVKLNIENAS